MARKSAPNILRMHKAISVGFPYAKNDKTYQTDSIKKLYQVCNMTKVSPCSVDVVAQLTYSPVESDDPSIGVGLGGGLDINMILTVTSMTTDNEH